MPWLTAKPQSCSDLTWFNKRKEEEKTQSLTTHTPCAVTRANTAKRHISLRPDSNLVKKTLSHTHLHTLLQCMLTEPTRSLWHTHSQRYTLAAAGLSSAGSSTGHVYELGGVYGCQRSPSLSSSLSSQVSVSGKQKWSVGYNSAIFLWFIGGVMKSHHTDRDQSCCFIQWRETVMQSRHLWKSLTTDEFMTDSRMGAMLKKTCDYHKLGWGGFAWLMRFCVWRKSLNDDSYLLGL